MLATRRSAGQNHDRKRVNNKWILIDSHWARKKKMIMNENGFGLVLLSDLHWLCANNNNEKEKQTQHWRSDQILHGTTLNMCNINVNTLNTFPISTFLLLFVLCDSSGTYTGDGLVSTSLMIVVILCVCWKIHMIPFSYSQSVHTHTHILTNTSCWFTLCVRRKK